MAKRPVCIGWRRGFSSCLGTAWSQRARAFCFPARAELSLPGPCPGIPGEARLQHGFSGARGWEGVPMGEMDPGKNTSQQKSFIHPEREVQEGITTMTKRPP